jgi:hypothetical protein
MLAEMNSNQKEMKIGIKTQIDSLASRMTIKKENRAPDKKGWEPR